MDYGFEHAGRVYTPNQTEVIATDNTTRNKTIEASELAIWEAQPDRMVAYYDLPQVSGTAGQLATVHHPGTATTWLGTRIGTIVSARLYRHNFGGRFVSVTVRGSNGATYHGRASYDWGDCVTLHKSSALAR